LINFNPNLLDLGSVSRNSVESISLEVFLRRLELLNRLPDKRWNLDDLPGSCAAFIELLFMKRATENSCTLQNALCSDGFNRWSPVNPASDLSPSSTETF